VRKAGRVTIAAGTALTAVLLPAAASTPVQAARPPAAPMRATGPAAWRLAASRHYGPRANASGYSAVIALGPRDAWAFGGTNPGGPSSPAAVHWDGRRWRPALLPPGLAGFIIAASASSGRDVWAVSYFGSYLLHWNGSRWSVARRWRGGKATSVAAVSPSDVWVFGGGSGLGTWHYNGRAWTRPRRAPAGLYRASALSSRSIWAVSRGAAGTIVHYDGRAWRPARTGTALAGVSVEDIAAVSARSVWVTGDTAQGRLVVAHGDVAQGDVAQGDVAQGGGQSWRRFAAPWQLRPQRFAADGDGGVWIPAVAGTRTWMVHLSRSGHWTRSLLVAGLGSGVGELARIPGTAALWGSGGFLTRSGGDAAIWSRGPVGPGAQAGRARH